VPKKKPMNLSDHIRLSVRLELARLALMSGETGILQHHVRKDSREHKKMLTAMDAVDTLRNWMDDIVCVDKPDGIGHACTEVYYGIDDIFDLNGELDNVLDNYAVRQAMHILEQRGRKTDTDEIVLTRFDSSKSIYFDEERDGKMFLHIKAGTGYVTTGDDGMISKRPPEDQINQNQTMYALTPCQIRDFCEDAMKFGEYPSDEDIERVVGQYRVISDDDADDVD
jgi:hypothetical protein